MRLTISSKDFDRLFSNNPELDEWFEENDIGVPGVIGDNRLVWLYFLCATDAAAFKLKWL